MLYSGEIKEYCLYCYDFDSSLGGDNKGRYEFIFFLFFYYIFGVLI